MRTGGDKGGDGASGTAAWSLEAHRALALPTPPLAPRAAYACDPRAGRGRVHGGAPSPTRSDYQRDRDRILHSTAFRRLKHKTQVFILHEGDHYRTRLTHTIEVAQVARSISRALMLDEDLAEAVALAHDLGHPPFGHAGEDALADSMADHGGFDHNAQSLRIVTHLERRYAEFDGLDLTWEALEGIVKHNGPVVSPLPYGVTAYAHHKGLELCTHAGLEAQAAAIADDVAYNAHDVDDGLRSGLFTLGDLRAVPFASALLDEIDARHGALPAKRRGHELVRRLITYQIEDVIGTAHAELVALRLGSPEEARALGRPVVTFSPAMREATAALKAFLYGRLYRHEAVLADRADAKRRLSEMFALLLESPDRLPEKWRRVPGGDPARHVCDYLAGMTDGYAFAQHARLTDG